MQHILKTVDPKSLILETDNAMLVPLGLRPGERDRPLTIISEVFNPTLVIEYWDIHLNAVGDFEVGLYQPSRECWLYPGEGWKPEQNWLSPAALRCHLKEVGGDLQFWIKGKGVFQSLKVGYTVFRDLVEVLCEFILPGQFTRLHSFSVPAKTINQGRHLSFPQNFVPQKIQNPQFKTPDRIAAIPAVVKFSPLDLIQLLEPLSEDSWGQLFFQYEVSAFYSDDPIFQVSQLPCVIFRRKQEENIHRPLWQDGTDSQSVFLSYSYDLLFDVYSLGITYAQSQSIASNLMATLEQENKIKIPTHDIEVGIQVVGNGKTNEQPGFVEGALFSSMFQVRVVRLADIYHRTPRPKH
jgi:hypothetical protein